MPPIRNRIGRGVAPVDLPVNVLGTERARDGEKPRRLGSWRSTFTFFFRGLVGVGEVAGEFFVEGKLRHVLDAVDVQLAP